MPTILSVSDHGVPTGYGRIADNVMTRLKQRGFDVFCASFAYDGLLPPQFNGQVLPYHVASLQNRPNWAGDVAQLVAVMKPDVVVVTQDAPYAEQVRYAPIDWSMHKMVVITPVDGAPIYPNWIELLRQVDGGLTISEYGVNAYREQGIQMGLCRPGVDVNTFFPYTSAQKLELRAKLGVSPTMFILGTMCQNQGRKSIPLMLEGFFEFAKDKPDAVYLLDMDRVSPAGWDIPSLCKQNGWDVNKLIFRDQCQQRGIISLTDRYNLLDAHVVLSHREGYGLPLSEAQACGVVSIALDYCSGTEVCGDGKGMLVKPIAFKNYSTWGGAMDYFPDVPDFVEKLNVLYRNPHQRAVLAEAGMKWSRQQSWDLATDAVQDVIRRVLDSRPVIQLEQKIDPPQPIPSQPEPTPAVKVMTTNGQKVGDTQKMVTTDIFKAFNPEGGA